MGWHVASDDCYEDLLHYVSLFGDPVEQRASLSNHSKPKAISIIGHQLRYNIRHQFPLITSKRVSWHSIVHELLWILKGSGNIQYLKDNKVTIWNEWADKNGDLGPVYPVQWRHFKSGDSEVDQVLELERNIKHVLAYPNHHAARRLILTAWNPADMPHPSVPTGCHTMVQFFIRGDILHSHLYMRSCDAFLGLPFNLASYALLTCLLAKRHRMQPGSIAISFGDLHIYENHIPQVNQQLGRVKRPLPIVKISDEVVGLRDLADVKFEMIELIGYDPHPAIKGEVAV